MVTLTTPSVRFAISGVLLWFFCRLAAYSDSIKESVKTFGATLSGDQSTVVPWLIMASVLSGAALSSVGTLLYSPGSDKHIVAVILMLIGVCAMISGAFYGIYEVTGSNVASIELYGLFVGSAGGAVISLS